MLGANNVSAICTVAPDWVPRVINIDMGAVAVRPDLAVGEVIQRQRFNIPINGAEQAIFYCDDKPAFNNVTKMETVMGSDNYAGGARDAKTTNLNGVAYRIRFVSPQRNYVVTSNLFYQNVGDAVMISAPAYLESS